MSISAELNTPTLVISTTSASGERKRFTISVAEIAELDLHSEGLRQIDLTKTSFKMVFSNEAYTQKWDYSATLGNGTQLGVYHYLILLHKYF